jgi:hypothetical protein
MKEFGHIYLPDTEDYLYICDAWKCNDFYEWHAGRHGLYWDEENPENSYVFEPVLDDDFDGDYGEAVTARTLPFKAYDMDGNLIMESDRQTTFWL